MFPRIAFSLVLILTLIAVPACLKEAPDQSGKRTNEGNGKRNDRSPATLPIPGQSQGDAPPDEEEGWTEDGQGSLDIQADRSIPYNDPPYPKARPKPDSRIIDKPYFLIEEDEYPSEPPPYPADWLTSDTIDQVVGHYSGKYSGNSRFNFFISHTEVGGRHVADMMIYIEVETESGDKAQYRYQIHIQPFDEGCEITLSRKL